MKKVGIACSLSSRAFRAVVLTALVAITTSCRRSEMAGGDQPTISTASEATNLNVAIERRIEAIRRTGFPVEMDELDRWLPAAPDDSQNGALIWTNVAAMVSPPPRLGRLPERCDALDARTNYFLRRILTANRVHLQKLHAASALPASRYPLPTAGDFAPNSRLERESDWAMNAVWLLRVEATLASEDRRVESALDSLNTMASLARGLAQPDAADLIQSGMVLLAACRSAERLLGGNALITPQLRKLQRVFRSDQTTNALTSHLVVLRCRVYFKYKHWQEHIVPFLTAMHEFDHDRPVSPSELERMLADFAEKKDANLLCYLEEMERLVEISKLPSPDMLRTARQRLLAIKQRLQNPEESRLAYALDEIRRTIEGEIFAFAQLAVLWRMAETAAAIECYQLDHEGRIPSAAADLVPTYLKAIPLDPFDGGPLHIRELAKGYGVYGIGQATEWDEIRFVVERCSN